MMMARLSRILCRRSSKRFLLIGVLIFLFMIFGYYKIINSILNPTDSHIVDDRGGGLGGRRGFKDPRFIKLEVLDLLVLVMSAPGAVNQRRALRDTWFGALPPKVNAKFVIGTHRMDSDLLTLVMEESSKHSDIILLENLRDSYENLTLKLLSMLVWANDNFKFKFLLKADDDTFVRLDKLTGVLRSKSPTGRLYWGFFSGRANVKRGGKWRESRWNLCDYYLPYAVGGGYVISSDLVDFVARNSDLFQLYRSEDVSLGAWLAGLEIDRVHDPRFDTEYKTRGCNNDYIVTHKQSVIMIYEKFESLSKNNRLCLVERQDRLSYIYNWTAPPSKCCNRIPGVP